MRPARGQFGRRRCANHDGPVISATTPLEDVPLTFISCAAARSRSTLPRRGTLSPPLRPRSTWLTQLRSPAATSTATLHLRRQSRWGITWGCHPSQAIARVIAAKLSKLSILAGAGAGQNAGPATERAVHAPADRAAVGRLGLRWQGDQPGRGDAGRAARQRRPPAQGCQEEGSEDAVRPVLLGGGRPSLSWC